MRLIRKLLPLFIVLGVIWVIYAKDIQDSKIQMIYQNITADLESWKENPNIQNALGFLGVGLDQIFGELNQVITKYRSDPSNPESPDIEKPRLSEPTSQSFSIHNIELGDTREEVEKLVGEAKRSSMNEYGVNWNAYHDQYRNFFMIAYDNDNKVAGLYTNQDLISSKQKIKIGSPKDLVLAQFGDPLTFLKKGRISYQVKNDGEYYLYQFEDSYITIFFDKHKENTVTAIQIISEELENDKSEFYAEGNQSLIEGFEYQLFDLTNSSRVVNRLQPLTWDDRVKITARDHSVDMAVNQYFDHTNIEGQSPFDRMEEDNISFQTAGENIAAGQLSSIFAHEGLMNSMGHRENILQSNFESLGIGVGFDTEEKPYYTQNFITK
ncbi:CAP domain-containing protein (plasmid) [Ureibacillus chungkukjangi]|uniref:CAP domain-containing protein n=1 Tax=Ureibacillus chungkukjangi TaxID=1202712 RepID=UPI0024AEC29E|nr:CAP domain-containing protein [Ureibacillus chungkukjangi]MDI7743490.1 CAP domain-containing protein [Lysinibacillus fusiformis]